MRFDNSYARELEGAFVPWPPAQAPRPRELFFNQALAASLDTGLSNWTPSEREAVFSGNTVPEGAQPIAQAYAGHQFGGFSPQLGDGRALLLGEVIDTQGHRQDVAFKGSGRTPFSRGGDGKAAVGPMLREVLIGESLHALGIPSTRALAVVATGDWVRRETTLPGAVLTRVSASHLRVGTFQYFAARGDHARLERLLDYALVRHPPSEEARSNSAGDKALSLLWAVLWRQARLVAQWMGVGFIHGVMNTDNMSISGQSIDFGPCAFMEAHDPATVYSSIDHHGRYAYANQPPIAQWNLTRLAEALLPLIQGSESEQMERAQTVIEAFGPAFDREMRAVWSRKLGWTGFVDEASVAQEAERLARAWQDLMQAHRVDHTQGWRALVQAAEGRDEQALALFRADADVGAVSGSGAVQAQSWLNEWRGVSVRLSWSISQATLRAANPRLIPRNHQVEVALQAASSEGDLRPFERLLEAIRRPGDDDEAYGDYAEPAPPEVASRHQTFCGT